MTAVQAGEMLWRPGTQRLDRANLTTAPMPSMPVGFQSLRVERGIGRRIASVFTRRHAKPGTEYAAEMRRTVEAVVEGDRRDGAVALCAAYQRTRALVEPASHDVACHGFVAV